MKIRSMVLLLFTIFMITLTCNVSYAEKTQEDEKILKTHSLLVSLGVIDSSEIQSYDTKVSSGLFEKIYKAYFGMQPSVHDENILNCDAVYNIAPHCKNTDASAAMITSFKDYGLIKATYRHAYKIACNNNLIDKNKEFLNPSDNLTYGDLLFMLDAFSVDFANTQNLQYIKGKVADAASFNNTITISISDGAKTTDIKFGRNNTFTVFRDSLSAPYSYNIKRSDNAEFFLKDDKPVFACVYDNKKTYKNAEINENEYNIFKSHIYIYNIYDSYLVLKDSKTGDYTTFSIDSDTILYADGKPADIKDINRLYLDVECYFVTDKSSNTVKYININ